MPLPSLPQVQQLIKGSALLLTAINEGSIQVLYRQKPVISEDRLSATWTVEVLILDLAIADLVIKALARLGFEIKRSGDTLRATREWVLTDADRAELRQADEANASEQQKKAQKQQQSEQQKVISDLQAEIEALREELELMALVPTKRGVSGGAGEPGPQGPAGRDGKDGQDLVATDAKLSDLQDVSPEAPSQGWVLTWSDATEQWEPKPPRVGISSIGGGAGGGDGGGGGTGLSFWEEVEEGHLLPIGPGQNIGSLERPIGELFATGNTIFLDGLPLALNGDQRLTFDGNVLAYGDKTFDLWSEGAAGELLPGSDDQLSVGSAAQQVRELWMGSGAVYFNSVPLEVDTDGRLTWNGNVLAYQSTGTMTQWEESGAGDLRPVVPYGQDLGDATNPVRSIYLGGVRLAVNSKGELTVNGVPLAFARGSVFSQSLGLEGGEIIEQPPVTDHADGGEVVASGVPEIIDDLDLNYLEADGGTLS